jgi:23S rRNA pseudouridine2457 synthase
LYFCCVNLSILLKYFIINKPYGVLSQFTGKEGELTLKTLSNFPNDVYPVGRLDKDSEGLLILTNDKKLNNHLLNPKFKHKRTYWVQVENVPTATDLKKLEAGVEISVDGKKYHTIPCKAKLIHPEIAERNPPIRFRKAIPTAWIELNLIEGKNRQVRKMTAAIGFPTLRLIRVGIEDLSFQDINEVVIEMEQKSLYKLLNVDYEPQAATNNIRRRIFTRNK